MRLPTEETDGHPVVVLSATRAFGVAQSRTELIQHFVGCGWRVVVAAAADTNVARLQAAGAEFFDVPFRSGGLGGRDDFVAWLRMRRLYRTLRPQLVHHFNTKPVILGSVAMPADSRAVVVNTITGMGFAFDGIKAPLARAAHRAAARRATTTIFQNRDDREFFLSAAILNEDRARLVVSSGVDTARFPERPARNGGPRRVLFVGRFVWQKGLAEFAEAARLLRAEHPEARFIVGGEFAPERPDAVPKEWMERQVADGVLHHEGYIRDMPAALASADVVVAPSRYGEGVPRVLLEAGCAGVPVVATDVAGCREVVVDGATGFLTPARDPHALADRLRILLEDGERAAVMGRAARVRVLENFAIEHILAQHLDIYRAAGIDIAPLA